MIFIRQYLCRKDTTPPLPDPRPRVRKEGALGLAVPPRTNEFAREMSRNNPLTEDKGKT